MEHYIGLDVSMKETHLCVVDETGKVVGRSCASTRPRSLSMALKKFGVSVKTVILETGSQSSWLAHSLTGSGWPVEIVDARRAKPMLNARLNKTDANDAEGLAQLARSGWYVRVLAKDPETRRRRDLLRARGLLVKHRRATENQLRGLLRGHGIVVGQVGGEQLEARVYERIGKHTELDGVAAPLLALRACQRDQIKILTDQITTLAAHDADCERLMSVPGVGPLVAQAYMTAIADPHRFTRSASVGAYLGLTNRRYQSGAVDWAGRISKQGDGLARQLLYEAAHVLMTRTKRDIPLKRWARRLERKIGAKKARVALARKLAVIMHRMWVDGTRFEANAKLA